MKNRDVIVIMGIILTIIAAELFILFNLYNQFFEIKANENESAYVLLKNGKYFEMECERDVIDNAIDYTHRPFSENSEKKINGQILKYQQKCTNENGDLKETTLRKGREDLRISQNIQTNGIEVNDGSYYYTRLDYPISPAMEENDEKITMQDSHCEIVIYKEEDQKYKLTDSSIRVGKEYSEEIQINIDMDIKCL